MADFIVTIYKTVTTVKDITCVMKMVRVSRESGTFPVMADSVVVSVADNTKLVYAEKADLANNQKVISGYFATDALDGFTDATIECRMGATLLASIPTTNLQSLVEPELFSSAGIPDATTAWLQTV